MGDQTRRAELIVFDLDDTLYSEWQHALSGYAAIAEALADELRADFDLVERMVHHYRTGDRMRVFNALLADLGRTDADVLVPRMIEIYRTHDADIRLFPDADAVLTRLRGKVVLGLLSDGPVEKQQAKVDKLGLADRVDHVVLTGRWGREFWKPHERGYRWLEEACGVSGPACVYVGNDVSKDFVAPNRLGWRTVMVDRPENLMKHAAAPGGEPGHVIETLDALEAVLG
ncbi:MAG: HAD family hydrolase [Phycisphaerae bacterium]|nr:HAD family hydrolase [Phycisphaerae bacterium]